MNGTNHVNGTSNGTPNGSHTRSKLLWEHASPQATSMFKYLETVNRKHGLSISMYPELHKWSIDHIDDFWRSVWDFVGIRHEGEALSVRTYHRCAIFQGVNVQVGC